MSNPGFERGFCIKSYFINLSFKMSQKKIVNNLYDNHVWEIKNTFSPFLIANRPINVRDEFLDFYDVFFLFQTRRQE